MEEKNKTIKSINPATNQIQKTFEIMDDKQIEAKLEKANSAFKEWKNTSFEERAEILKKVAGIMQESKEELARLCSIEMGKPLEQGVGEIMVCVGIFNYYAENGAKLLQDKTIPVSHGKAFISYEPIGVLLSVQPWNFPFYQVSRSSAPHIMAGNTYVLKHSSNVPQCAAMMEKIFRDAGAPEGVFTNLFIPGAKASEIISNKYIKGVTFTGSESAGGSIAEISGKNVKKSILELGGSDPLIVLEDTDLDTAVKMATMGRLSNAGQICTSPKRIIVVEAVAKEFTEKCKAIYENIKIGDPLTPGTQLGPLVNEEARDKVLEQVDETVKAGARIVYGDKKYESEGAYMYPVILTDIQPGMLAYSEEIFGPVLCIYAVRDEEEAIKVANDTKFGLGASIFTSDETRGIKIARKVESGMVFINHVTTSVAELPFGGVKNSGYGRELSEEGIMEFVNHKLIRISEPEAEY